MNSAEAQVSALVKSVSGVSPRTGTGSRAHRGTLSQSPATEPAGWLSSEGEDGTDAEEGED